MDAAAEGVADLSGRGDRRRGSYSSDRRQSSGHHSGRRSRSPSPRGRHDAGGVRRSRVLENPKGSWGYHHSSFQYRVAEVTPAFIRSSLFSNLGHEDSSALCILQLNKAVEGISCFLQDCVSQEPDSDISSRKRKRIASPPADRDMLQVERDELFSKVAELEAFIAGEDARKREAIRHAIARYHEHKVKPLLVKAIERGEEEGFKRGLRQGKGTSSRQETGGLTDAALSSGESSLGARRED